MRSEFPQKFGAYVLLGPLGEGGMGAVYLAMSGHREMETLCVVKRLLPELLSHPDHVLRFRHEADLARRLVHSNLAHTNTIGEVDGEVFLVQELVEGHDVSAVLDELRHRRRALPVPVAVHIASEIAQGLSYAHDFDRLDLIHRDINPPNIRLTYSGEVKLLDFGIAASNLHGEGRGEHRGAGKLWHLAPEQVRPGGVIDRRTDLYALGMVLWELLTQRPVGTVRQAGRDARQAETEGEVLVWITRGEHQAPSVWNPEVPPELDALVAKATHVNPDYRFLDADELRGALAAFIPAGFTPEPILSSLMKELFSPEAERAERRRLVEGARFLLSPTGAPRLQRTRAADVAPRAAAGAGPAPRRVWRWWLPIVVGGLAGMGTLVWRSSLRQPEGNPPATGAAADAAAVVLPAASTLAERPAVPRPAPAGATAPAPPRPTTETKTTHAIAPLPKRTEEVAAPAKADHLHLAREAFNDRDWPRALGEGKAAVSAGGGAEAHALLGNTYFKMGRFAEAESAYAMAVALDPGNALLQERLRIARVRAHEAAGAEEN